MVPPFWGRHSDGTPAMLPPKCRSPARRGPAAARCRRRSTPRNHPWVKKGQEIGWFYGCFMGFNGSFMGFDGSFMGFIGSFMDLPSGKHTKRLWNITIFG